MSPALAYRLLLVPIVALACMQHTVNDSRERLASALRDSLQHVTDAQVAFVRDSTHLLIELSGPEFYGMTDSMFPKVANDFARFALRHYDKASQLDSISVMDRDSVAAGWRIIHLSAFSVGELRSAP